MCIRDRSKIDPDLVIADENLSIINGAISATGWANANKKDSMAYMYFTALADYYGFDVNTPYKDCLLYTSRCV